MAGHDLLSLEPQPQVGCAVARREVTGLNKLEHRSCDAVYGEEEEEMVWFVETLARDMKTKTTPGHGHTSTVERKTELAARA